MGKFAKTIFLLVGLYLIEMSTTYACSVAFYTGNPGQENEMHLIGRTADLLPDLLNIDYHITIYPRGVEHNGNTSDGSLVNPATWTSKYGSLIVQDFVEGVNEKGLSVQPLYLGGSVYPYPSDVTPCVSILKLTSYFLDNAATVSECIKLLGDVMVVSDKYQECELPIHWAIRDSSNDVAIIEFVNGGTKKKPKSKIVIYRGSEYDVLTNEPYLNKQLKYYKAFSKGEKALPGDFNGMARFVRLKVFKNTLTAGASEWESVVNMFSLMSSVHCMPGVVDYSRKEPKEEKQWPTIWTSVTDMDNLKFYIKITKYPNTIWLDLKKINFETLSKTGILDPRSFDLSGEVNGNIQWQ